MAVETASTTHTLPDTADSLGNRVGRNVSHVITRSLYEMGDFKDHIGRLGMEKILNSKYLFPTEVQPDEGAVDRAHELLDEGYSFIVAYNHSNKREPLDCMTTLVGLGGKFVDAEYLTPLAWHQQKIDVHALSHVTGIPLMPIVTSDTIEQGANRLTPPLRERISATIFRRELPEEKILPERFGLPEYLDEGGNVLTRGGIVFVAPQGGRRDELGQPKGRAVELLIRNAKRKGMDKIAVWPMGISLQDKVVYDDQSNGLNRTKVADVKFGIPLTIEELQNQTHHHNESYADNLTLDQFIFTILAEHLPPAYTGIERADTI